jgi:alkylated DNA repair dioxygenase AlkB
LTWPVAGATIEHMFLQGSLFGSMTPALGVGVPIEREALDEQSWVDVAPQWLVGADSLFDELHAALPWRQRRGVMMYDRVVDEPRLSHWWAAGADTHEPLPILGTLRRELSDRYGLAFDSIGFNLYRDGRDSVAWHGDRHRHTVVDPVVAIVSVGAPRALRLRPQGGGPSRSWNLGGGDLFVMGGACQHDWEHSVPKAAPVGPRISITYRHGATTSVRRR